MYKAPPICEYIPIRVSTTSGAVARKGAESPAMRTDKKSQRRERRESRESRERRERAQRGIPRALSNCSPMDKDIGKAKSGNCRAH